MTVVPPAGKTVREARIFPSGTRAPQRNIFLFPVVSLFVWDSILPSRRAHMKIHKARGGWPLILGETPPGSGWMRPAPSTQTSIPSG